MYKRAERPNPSSERHQIALSNFARCSWLLRRATEKTLPGPIATPVAGARRTRVPSKRATGKPATVQQQQQQ
ncbi:unnamed protein product [Lampetra fluviatilis]